MVHHVGQHLKYDPSYRRCAEPPTVRPGEAALEALREKSADVMAATVAPG